MAERCNHAGCSKEATGAVGLELYPVKAVMDYYRTTQPVTRVVIGLALCDECRGELKVAEWFPPEKLGPMLRLVGRSAGVAMDPQGCKFVKVDFDDPEYLALLRQRTGSQEALDAR